jgi:hypothetical protein
MGKGRYRFVLRFNPAIQKPYTSNVENRSLFMPQEIWVNLILGIQQDHSTANSFSVS